MASQDHFQSFLELLRCPATKGALSFHRFAEPSNALAEGVLVTADKTHFYAVAGGVPIMLPKSIPPEFATKYRAQLEGLGLDAAPHVGEASSWSFSDQWQAFEDLELERTWGFSTQERVDMFFLETMRTPDEVASATVVDAGCGNGRLTEALGAHARMVIGIDFSESVFADARRNKAPNVFFIKGDLQKPPLADGSIDIIVSNGVLHHTPNTRRAFEALAEAVAPDGSYYIWLYSHSGAGSLPRRALRRANVGLRGVVSKLPGFMQVGVVHAYTTALAAKIKLSGQPQEHSYQELYIGVHDHLTPKHRTMHTPTEVAEWYFESGFGPVALTHWDNRYGFGVVAKKTPMTWTPGENHYEPRGTVKRFGL